MSSEQSLDPQLIEKTKQQIRLLVNEISLLAKSDMAPAEFYGEFLPRVVSALAAIGGAVWVVSDQGRLTLGYHVNIQETRLRDNEEGQIRHGRLLHKVLAGGEASLVPPHTGSGDDEAGNPTDFLLVMAPLKAADESVGVVEVFQRPDTGPAVQKGYLKFLVEMCDRAGEFFKSHQLRHFTDRQVLWTQLEEFTRAVHASLHPRETAYTIANEGRRLIQCDRVSVAIRRGRKCLVESVSGQDLFDKRSNTVRLLGKLATAVVASGEPVWYTGDTSNMAPQVEDAVQEYVDESHTKTVAVLPLKRPEASAEGEDDPDKRPEPHPFIGALIVEQIEDVRVPERMLQRVDVVSQHSSTALANALEHDNLFLMPLWRALGKARWVLKARTLPKTGLVALAVVSLIAALVLVKWDLQMKAKGTLEPVVRQDVYAGIQGRVVEVPVRHRDKVQKDALLARLEYSELAVQIEDVSGSLTTTLERKRSLERQRDLARRLGAAERSRMAALPGEIEEVEEELRSLQSQLKLLRQQEKELEVRSPIAGQVVTWDVKRVLMRQVVERGQLLMEVADPEGPWQLEVLMPEDQMGFITRARAAKKKENIEDDLEVEFILMTEPNKKHVGKVKEIELSAEVRGDEGNTVLIKVEISDELRKKLPEPLRPGAEVRAKVDCGRRAVGYVMFHKLIAFIQSRLIFPWF